MDNVGWCSDEQGENKRMAKAGTGTMTTAKSGPKPRGMTADSTTKEPQAVDRHVGSRVRMQRLLSGMSQEKLGEACGITFQQIQKYEKGMNRMGASRMHQIAPILQVPVEIFFEGAPSEAASDGLMSADRSSLEAAGSRLRICRCHCARSSSRLRSRSRAI